MDIVVKKEHPLTKDIFPLGFKTALINNYSKEDRVVEGFWTNLYIAKMPKRIWVEDKLIPKGTYISSTIIGIDGEEYNSDVFYRLTGRSFSEFFDK